MKKSNMLVVSPDKKRHMEGTIDLVSKTFSGWQNYHTVRKIFINRALHGHYDWDATRIGIIDGKIVTHYGVWGYHMRIGSSTVKVAGVGFVATHADYRKRGLMNDTTNASIEAMRSLGYDITFLFGIDNFYHKFGYVRAWPERDYVLDVKTLPSGKPMHRLRKFDLRNRSDIDRIYNNDHKRCTGTAVRPTYRRSGLLPSFHGYRWCDDAGETIGYVMVSIEDKLVCAEAGGDTDQVLRVLAHIARRHSLHEVKFLSGLHHDHPLARKLRVSTSRSEESARECGGAMIRLLDLESTLRKVTRELSRRLRNSPLAKWKGTLMIATAKSKSFLTITNSRIAVSGKGSSEHSIRGGGEIAQLIIGTGDPPDTVRDAGIKVTGDARHLLPVLFPNQYPTLAPWDRY